MFSSGGCDGSKQYRHNIARFVDSYAMPRASFCDPKPMTHNLTQWRYKQLMNRPRALQSYSAVLVC